MGFLYRSDTDLIASGLECFAESLLEEILISGVEVQPMLD